MKIAILILPLVVLAECSTTKNTTGSMPGVINTSQEQSLIHTSVESIEQKGVQSQEVNNLIFAANLCASKLENITESLNTCYEDSSRMKLDLTVCSNNLEEMKKLHRWDWFGNFGDTIKGFFYGNIFAIIAMIVLAFVARAKKFISF